MPMRNAEKSYNPHRDPHQLVGGPEFHDSIPGVALAYINLMEERIYVLDLELSAMRDKFGHQIYGKPEDNLPEENPPPNPAPGSKEERAITSGAFNHDAFLLDQMGAVRARNTELEEQNRALRLQMETMRAQYADLSLHPNVWAASAMSWCRDTFGGPIATDVVERGARLFEEAAEVAQAAGVPDDMMGRILGMVLSKPKGQLPQELGGVIVCWGVMCAALGFAPGRIMADALADCWTRHDTIRAKLATKIAMGASPFKLSPGDGQRPNTAYTHKGRTA